MSESFLSFAKKYLSKNQADPGNHPDFASMFLRVPGTINMKKKYGVPAIVETEYEWSYDPDLIVSFGDLHPSTMLFYDFMTHMRITAGNQLSRKKKYGYKPRYGSIYWWIEHLHETAISDCRKRILWLILAPYAINVRKMTSENAFIWIKQWTDLCNSNYPFESGFNVDQKIDYYITLAEGNGHMPLSSNNLSDFILTVEGNIPLWDFLKKTMNHHSVLYDVKKGGYQKV